MHDFDLVVRGGLIVDGLGGEPFHADLAIRDGIIAGIGKVNGTAREEIDATGLLVTPGFVDVHTHYDAQVIWESRLTPSSDHGVTTAIMGNCGVGFAPCRPSDRKSLIALMEGVEDIPGVVMDKGLTWEWESYPEYLDAVAARPHDIDIASYVPHAPLRLYVMGDRAVAGSQATGKDRAAMAALVEQAMKAGAIGFATSRSLFHKSASGEAICTIDADLAELSEIADAVRSGGDGILQVAADFGGARDFESEFDLLESVARSADRVVSMPIAQMHSNPNLWRQTLGRVREANASGARMGCQALPRGIGILLGLELSAHPFFLKPSYREVAGLPIDARLAALRDPVRRERILAEDPVPYPLPIAQTVGLFEGMFEVTNPLDYEPLPSSSIRARAEVMGVDPAALAYDILLAHGGEAALYLPFANYADGSLDAAWEMFEDPDVVLGLGDGGAHYGLICDASYPTFLLAYWVRDRTRGPRLDLAKVVRALTHDTAQLVGLSDRGVLAPGYKADVNVIDHARLRLDPPHVVADLPEQGKRLKQAATGYVATIVSGEVVYREGAHTGALPGKLVRGRQSQPQLQPALVS